MTDDWIDLSFEVKGFEWNNAKETSNWKKHRITFEEATEIFSNPVLTRSEYIDFEERTLAIGVSGGSLLCVAFTEKADKIRIISARKATPTERRRYGSYFSQRS